MTIPILYPDDARELTAAGVGIPPRDPDDDTVVDHRLQRLIEIRAQLDQGPFLSAFDAGY